MFRNLQYYAHMHTHKHTHGSTKVASKEKLRQFSEDCLKTKQSMHLASTHAIPQKAIGQKQRMALTMRRKSSRDCIRLIWWLQLKSYTNGAKTEVKSSRQTPEGKTDYEAKRIIFVAKIIVKVFLDGPLPKSINKYLALHLITGQIVIKAHCSFLFSR